MGKKKMFLPHLTWLFTPLSQFTLLGLWLVIFGMGTYVFWMVLESQSRGEGGLVARAAPPSRLERTETADLDKGASVVQ